MNTSPIRQWWHEHRTARRRSEQKFLDRSAGSIGEVMSPPWGPLY